VPTSGKLAAAPVDNGVAAGRIIPVIGCTPTESSAVREAHPAVRQRRIASQHGGANSAAFTPHPPDR